MTNKLQQYFPMIRTEEEVLSEINSRLHLKQMYEEWEEEERKEFLDFVTGAKGVKMMYDFISKEILDPELYEERVEEFLSLLLGQSVKILEVLPNEETDLSDGYSILIMDIVVELENGSIVNLEIQKNGYMFPGERSACYSADLLLRQYRRVRMKNKEEGQKKKSCYRDIKDVYTIVLFETSPSELHRFRDRYLHHFEQISDSGAKMNLLQKYLFVALDNFRSIKHNESSEMVINNRLEAWLAFMCMDDPDDILKIIEMCPDFKEMYEQIYDICRNLDGVMRMFSKELQELDRNSVELMVDEMQKDLDKTREELEVKFYDSVADDLLKFAVIVSRYDGKWVFCKHKERDTYESPGGHREEGEAILDTAKRELQEETGAVKFSIEPVCVYSVTGKNRVNDTGEETFGLLCYTDIEEFSGILDSEMEKVVLLEELPDNWTYPQIQPKLIAKVIEREL